MMGIGRNGSGKGEKRDKHHLEKKPERTHIWPWPWVYFPTTLLSSALNTVGAKWEESHPLALIFWQHYCYCPCHCFRTQRNIWSLRIRTQKNSPADDKTIMKSRYSEVSALVAFKSLIIMTMLIMSVWEKREAKNDRVYAVQPVRWLQRCPKALTCRICAKLSQPP